MLRAGKLVAPTKRQARIVGDVTYKTLEMHLDAVVQGKLIHAEPKDGLGGRIERAAAD